MRGCFSSSRIAAMSTPCPKCGTLLLGMVNRCWKCATPLEEERPPAPEKFPTIRPGAQLVQPSLAAVRYEADEPLAALAVDAAAEHGDAVVAAVVASAASAESSADMLRDPARVG